MNLKEIKIKALDGLCSSDKRSTNYREPSENFKKEKCSCHECFYGADEWSNDILSLLGYIEEIEGFSEVANDDIKNWM